jgi:hypothetical protein
LSVCIGLSLVVVLAGHEKTPGVVKMSETFSDKPDVALCDQGLHSPAWAMMSLA